MDDKNLDRLNIMVNFVTGNEHIATTEINGVSIESAAWAFSHAITIGKSRTFDKLSLINPDNEGAEYIVTGYRFLCEDIVEADVARSI